MGRRTLNICHVTESFLPKLGGMQIVVDQVAAELAERGNRVIVVCPDYGDLDGPTPTAGYQIERCFGRTLPTFGVGVWAWRRLLDRERFDIVHAHNVWPGGTLGLMARRSGAKVVVTSHGRDILTEPSIGYGSRLNPLLAFITGWTLDRVDAHTVVSASMVGPARAAGSDPDKVFIVPNFLSASVGVAGSDQEREVAADEPYLLMVGRLHPVKGIDLALAAFSGARREFPAYRLKIVGDGSEGARLRALAGKLGIGDSVDWLGAVTGEQKDELVKRAAAVLVTSRVEAFCLAALEAMALGVPVIVPDRAPFTDIIGARSGLFIDPGEPRTLTVALRRLDEPGAAAEIGGRVREVAATFTRSAAVDAYEEIYRRLMG